MRGPWPRPRLRASSGQAGGQGRGGGGREREGPGPARPLPSAPSPPPLGKACSRWEVDAALESGRWGADPAPRWGSRQQHLSPSPVPAPQPFEGRQLGGGQFWLRDGQWVRGTLWALEGRPCIVTWRAGVEMAVGALGGSPSSPAGPPPSGSQGATRSGPSALPTPHLWDRGREQLLPVESGQFPWGTARRKGSANRSRADKLAFKRERDTDLL